MGFVVLDNQQILDAALDELLDVGQRFVQRLLGYRLLQIRDCALMQPTVAALHHRDDMHRNMPRGRIMLESVQHTPAIDDRQLQIKRNGVGLPLAGQGQPKVATRGDNTFEALISGQIQQDARKGRIIFDDQQHTVARVDRLTVVADLAVQQQFGLDRKLHSCASRRRSAIAAVAPRGQGHNGG